MRAKNPGSFAGVDSFVQSQRRDAGMDFMTLLTWDPQPPHVVFLQVGQVTG